MDYEKDYKHLSILEFFESLRCQITSHDIKLKKKALLRMSDYLSEVALTNSNALSVNFLVEFYANILSEHYDLLPTILEGLSLLIDCENFSDNDGKLVASKLVQLDVPQYNPKTRLQIYKLLQQLLRYHLEPLKSIGDGFLSDYISAIDGENSPDCVYAVMQMNSIIAGSFCINAVYEEYFESISAYFPIEFKSSGSKTGTGLTRDMLVELNKQCMLSSPLFGAQLLPLLLDKISSDKRSARIEALDILADGLPLLDFSDVLNYHMTFIDCLLIEVKTRIDDSQQLALRCAGALSRVFQDKADESAILEFSWHLFEVLGGGVLRDSDTVVMQFFRAVVEDKPRVWCALMAHLLPVMMEKCGGQLDDIASETGDTDMLNAMAQVLAAGTNWVAFPGLVNSAKARHFFTRLHLVFTDMLACPVTEHSQENLSIVFRLLAYYSLFDVWVPDCGAEANFVTDTVAITESRRQLVSGAIGRLVLMSSDCLEQALVALVPLLMIHQANNDLVTMIAEHGNGVSGLQVIAFRLLALVPLACVPIALSAIGRQLCCDAPAVLDVVTGCLVTLVDRFAIDTDAVAAFVADPLLANLLTKQASISDNTVTNVALALGSLGSPSDDSVICDIIHRLLGACQLDNAPRPCVTWLCSILGQSPIGVVERCMGASDLLQLLYGLICRKPQLNGLETTSLLCQVYASIANKSQCASELTDMVTRHCGPADGAAGDNQVLLLLWTLKGSMLSGGRHFVDKLGSVITDPANLSGAMGRSLVRFIEVLHTPAGHSAGKKRQICSEEKLFPFSGFLYEQFCYCSLAQSFLRLATATGDSDKVNGVVVRHVSMELYLQLVGSHASQSMDQYIDEISLTVGQWLSQFAVAPATKLSAEGVSLRLRALRAVYTLHSKADDNNRLLEWADDIGDNIGAACEASCELAPQDRLLLAKLIGWFTSAFREPKQQSQYEKYRHLFQKCVRQLISDRKRIVRQEAAKSMMQLFC